MLVRLKMSIKGNHPRFTLDKYPNVWLILKLYKIPGSPKVGTEKTHRKSENKEVGERWMEQREKQKRYGWKK